MKFNHYFSKPVIAALCALALSPTLAFAGHNGKTAAEKAVIKSVDMTGQTLIVTGSKNTDQTFRWNDTTKFKENKKSVTSAQLAPGEGVHLTYHKMAGTPLLRSVNITPAKASKSAAHKQPVARS